MTRLPDSFIPRLVPALLMGIVPHVTLLNPWITASCALSWIYLLAGVKKNWPLPPRWLTAVLTFAAFAGILVSARGTFSGEAGIGLLCLMAALKPLEIKSYRDRMITLFLAYFMVIAALFFSSSLEMTAYLYFSVVGITGCLVMVNHPDIMIKRGLKLALTITAQALPLSLILFLVFPRIPGSLWGIQVGASNSVGLSDTLSPGSMSDLRKSEETALRVSFDGPIPGMNQRYFRAYVFQVFDGKNWKIAYRIPQASFYPEEGEPWRYTVILEPHQQRYIITLDYPGDIPPGYRLAQDLTIQARDRVAKPLRYSLVSYPGTGPSAFQEWESLYLDLPDLGNPRARALAGQLRAQSVSVSAFSDTVLGYFATQDFYYTLNPPVSAQADTVDDFLFNTRKGYCEHYASAFVFLMRAAGVPARVVGGYYGGEINPLGEFLVLRQKDAHAWAEVYMEEKGWVRMDPTAAVDPSRVEREATPGGAEGLIRAGEGREGFFLGIPRKIRWAWETLNYQWYARVIGYSTASQRQFLERLGLSLDSLAGIVKTAMATLSVMAGLMLFYYLRLQMKTEQGRDRVRKGYDRFLAKLRKVGIDCSPSSGPLDLADRASAERKDLEKEIRGITALYVLLRYGGKQEDEDLIHDFLVQVARFGPKRKP